MDNTLCGCMSGRGCFIADMMWCGLLYNFAITTKSVTRKVQANKSNLIRELNFITS